MKKIFYKFLLIASLVFIPGYIYAANPEVSLYTPDNIIGLNKYFYVDVLLSAQDNDINGIEGYVSVPNTDIVKLIRVEDGQSILRAWLVHPDITGNRVNFSGIVPNGFSGVIDPLDGVNKKPGNIVRLVFQSLKPGSALVSVNDINITYNDGYGTIKSLNPVSFILNIGDNIDTKDYVNNDTNKPELIAMIEKDENLFDNKYTLIFQAIDRGTGIKEVTVKEGIFGKWNVTQSPYLLEDQSHQSIIKLKATDNASNFISVVIYPPLYKILGTIIVAFIVTVLALLLGKKHKKRHAKNK